jgi:hypothetical protein
MVDPRKSLGGWQAFADTRGVFMSTAPPRSPAVRSARANLAGLSRILPADDPEIVEARRRLAEAHLCDAIERAVGSDPPLTRAQWDRCARLIQAAKR